jgi:hypothetical protein
MIAIVQRSEGPSIFPALSQAPAILTNAARSSGVGLGRAALGVAAGVAVALSN